MPKIPTSIINLKLGKGLSFSSEDSNGNKISVGTPEIDGEEFNGFSPGDMMLTSLAACSGIDVVTILKKQRQYVTNLEIKVTGTQEKDAPWTWIKAHIEYTIKGQNHKVSVVLLGSNTFWLFARESFKALFQPRSGYQNII